VEQKDKGKGKGTPATPYSLRRTKHPITRFGSAAETNNNNKPPKSKSSQKPSSRPSSRNSNVEDDEEEEESVNETKYQLRPRSKEISYKV
jgi:hypothetical protein